MDRAGSSPRSASRRAKQLAFVLAGSAALALAVLGVVMPVLPTTPFLLLAAFCFARGSDRVHRWLLGNRVFGRQLEGYLAGKGVSPPVKAGALLFLWVTIGVSAAFFVPFLWARIPLGLIGLAVSAHILLVKTRTRGSSRQSASPRPSACHSADPRTADPQRMPES